MNIVILAGGLSMERDVSLVSGNLIAKALRAQGNRAVLVDLYFGIKKEDMTFDVDQGEGSYKIGEQAPDLELIKKENGGRQFPIGENVIEFCKMADAVFLALHGGVGEDGRLQALLEMHGIRFTGSSSLGCAIAMDKALSKELARSANVPTAEWIVLDGKEGEVDKMLPCFVKPADNGSSVGVSRAETPTQLEAAVAEAAKYSKKVIVEREIAGREFSVGILDGVALPPIEIVTGDTFYDYKTKYQAGIAREICPAPIDKELTETVQGYAVAMHKILCLGSYSRIDFIMNGEGRFYFLEANALPGMTPTSLLPQEAAAAGITYNDLCNKIIELSI